MVLICLNNLIFAKVSSSYDYQKFDRWFYKLRIKQTSLLSLWLSSKKDFTAVSWHCKIVWIIKHLTFLSSLFWCLSRHAAVPFPSGFRPLPGPKTSPKDTELSARKSRWRCLPATITVVRIVLFSASGHRIFKATARVCTSRPTGFLLLVFSAGAVDLSASSAQPFYIVRVSYAFIIIIFAAAAAARGKNARRPGDNDLDGSYFRTGRPTFGTRGLTSRNGPPDSENNRAIFPGKQRNCRPRTGTQRKFNYGMFPYRFLGFKSRAKKANYLGLWKVCGGRHLSGGRVGWGKNGPIRSWVIILMRIVSWVSRLD